MHIGSSRPEGVSERTQIHPIRQLWHFHREVWIYLLCRTDFFALIPLVMTPALSRMLVGFRPGNCSWLLCVRVMFIIFSSCHTDWPQWIWHIIWPCRGCHSWQYTGDNLSGQLFDVEWCHCMCWKNGVDNLGEGLIWDVEVTWEQFHYDVIS